ncbi:MAG: hypothetical protein ACRDG9_05080 [Actinomycetota bacterium]
MRTFLAILGRDLFVTVNELPSFAAQAILQPLFMAFVFGKVLTDLGLAQPGFAQLLIAFSRSGPLDRPLRQG